MDDSKDDVLAAHHEAVSAISALLADRARSRPSKGGTKHSVLLNRGAPVTNPAGFWGDALASAQSNPKEASEAIRLASANLRMGNIEFVMDSGVGQVAWLSAMAVELKADADALPPDSPRRARLLELSMRAQNAAAKLMLSLGALARLGAERNDLEYALPHHPQILT